jgi:acetyl-CoA carboxylase biotin carboxyl carrier protein
MADPPFDFNELMQLIELIKASSQFSEFKLRAGGMELELKRGAPLSFDPRAAATTSGSAAEKTGGEPAPASSSDDGSVVTGAIAVTSPMVGTVYLAPEPGAAHFVKVGQRVDAGAQLCIVEVMKLMSPVLAEFACEIREVRVNDSQSVEFGQVLFVISRN